jgi:hypothetical protein
VEDFATELNAAMAEQGGDEPEGTPAAAPETPQPEQAEQAQPAGDEGQAPTPESEPDAEPGVLQALRQKYADNPELVDEIYRYTDGELKRGFTPKLQKLSELEQRLEGIEPGDVDFWRQVHQKQQAGDYRGAAELMREAAQYLEGPVQQPQPAPEEEPEFATEVERQLWIKAQQLEQRLAANDNWRQQEQQARNRAEIDATFSRLEAEAGRPIPFEERQQIANWCVQNGMRDQRGELVWAPKVDHAWKVLNFDKVRQQARSEGASVAARKAEISPGPSTITRNQPPPREPETIEEVVRAAVRAAGQ